MTTVSKSERQEALARLREWLKPGDTIHCILRHVSRSGMQQVIQLVHIEPTATRASSVGEANARDVSVAHIGYNVAKVLGKRYDRQREGIVIGGCGMDMGFALVYELARTLWPEGVECTGEGCNSNDHSNGVWVSLEEWAEAHPGEEFPPHNGSRVRTDPRGPGVMHKDGGYALRHRWL